MKWLVAGAWAVYALLVLFVRVWRHDRKVHWLGAFLAGVSVAANVAVFA